MLISSLPSRTDSKSNRADVLKQIRTDFRQLQELNNKMMATTWEREALDFSFLSEMISRIKGWRFVNNRKAIERQSRNRLTLNEAFPKAIKIETH